MTAEAAIKAALDAAVIPIAEAAECNGALGRRACVLTPPHCQCRRVASDAIGRFVRQLAPDPRAIVPVGDSIMTLAELAAGVEAAANE